MTVRRALRPTLATLAATAAGGGGHRTAVLRSAALTLAHTTVVLPRSARARVYAYEGAGRLVSGRSSSAPTVTVDIPAGGFTIVQR